MSKRRDPFIVGPSVRVPMSECLGCGKRMDGATGVDHRSRPKPGHITICIGCGHLMAFAEDMRLRNLTDAEMYEDCGRSAPDRGAARSQAGDDDEAMKVTLGR